MKRATLLTLLLALPLLACAQHHHEHNRLIEFPDVPGYQVLKVDLHMHTVFSDGSVWPNIRVQEAIRDGLDAIAITEHLEYQPHEEDIPHPDRNRAYIIALQAAQRSDLLIIPGSEITRSMPPGHSNAVFIDDANALLLDDAMAVFEEAKRQGGFTFWNHPNWTAQRKDGVARLEPMHQTLIEQDLLHGIEVVNETTYSEEALQIALDHDLTIIGTSDVHGLIDWLYDVPHNHRPVTLVFATERSVAGIEEGLRARRTAVWFDNLLIGREAQVVPLLEASVRVAEARYRGDTQVLDVTLENTSDMAVMLENQTDFTFHANADVIMLPTHATKRLAVKTLTRQGSIELTFSVLNAVTAPGQNPTLTLSVTPSE